MNRNTTGLLLGCVGAAMTVLAYQQTVVSSTQCIGAGLAVLVCALCIKESARALAFTGIRQTATRESSPWSRPEARAATTRG